MTEDDKSVLMAARFQFIIKDPYPEITEWEQNEQLRGTPWEKLNHPLEGSKNEKPELSAHRAWQDGFNFAWDLIEKKLKEMK